MENHEPIETSECGVGRHDQLSKKNVEKKRKVGIENRAKRRKPTRKERILGKNYRTADDG